jgi:CubicO group peptidase (beta-lactamase class C family)
MKRLFITAALICLGAPFVFAGSISGRVLTEFDTYVQVSLKKWNVPGMSVGIVKGDKIVYAKGFGVRSLGADAKVDENTVFQIGSCSKNFAAAMFGVLVEKGLVNWADPVKKHFPRFKLFDKSAEENFTLADMLGANNTFPANAADGMMLFAYDTKNIIPRIKYIRAGAYNKDAKRYAYQNISYVLASAVIEKKTHKSWQKSIKRYLTGPLGMADTTFTKKDLLKSKNHAEGHVWGARGLEIYSQNIAYAGWPYGYALAGGINSSAKDLCKWITFQFYGKEGVLEKSTLEYIQKEYVYTGLNDDKYKQYYCLGWRKCDLNDKYVIYHSGLTDSMHAFIAFDPAEEIGIVILSNVAAGNHSLAFGKMFFDLYYGHEIKDTNQIALDKAIKKNNNRLAAQKKRTQNVVPSPAKKYKYYTGKYHNDLYGYIRIKNKAGKLTAYLGTRRVPIKLTHSSGDSFNASGVKGWRLKKPYIVFYFNESSDKAYKISVNNMTDGVEPFFLR